MGQLGGALPWALASLVLLAGAGLAAWRMEGQVRSFVASLAGVVGIGLAVVAFKVNAPPPTTTPAEMLAGVQSKSKIPTSNRELAQALTTRAQQETTRGDTRAAQASYERARALYRAEKDILGEANVALGLGQMEHLSGQSEKARANYSEAVALFKQGGSAVNQARTLAALGDLEKDTFHGPAAAEFYRQAREVWSRTPEPKSDPHVLLNIDRAPSMPNGEAKARATLDQARKIYDQIGDKLGVGDVAMLSGALELNLNRPEVAIGRFNDARVLFAAAHDQRREGEALLQIAALTLRQGLNRDTRDLLTLAQGAFKAVTDEAGTARTNVLIGDLERMQGNMKAAQAAYLAGATGLKTVSTLAEAEAEVKLAQVALFNNDTEAAKAAVTSAATIFRRANNKTGEAAAWLTSGLVSLKAGNVEPAKSDLNSAVQLFEQIKESLGHARAVVALSAAEIAAKRTEQGRIYARDAAAEYEAAKSTLGQAVALLGMGDAERANGNREGAVNAYKQAATVAGAIPGGRVAEANRILGLPALEQITVRAAQGADMYTETERVGAPVVADPLKVAANLTEFPAQNAEARALLAELDRRLEEAKKFVDAL